MTPGKREALMLGALLATVALIQSVHITRPFLRHHESVGTEIGKHARNHLKFGLSKTLGLRVDVSGPSLEPYGDPRRFIYPNHPPLPVLVVTAAFALFGSSEVVFRSVLIVASLISVVLARRLAARLVPPPWDWAATVLFALQPMFLYYSIVTALQVLGMIGILSALTFYLRWCESARRQEFAGLMVSIAFACACAWSGYYIVLVLLAAHVGNRLPRRNAVGLLVAWNVALFGLYLLYLRLASPPEATLVGKLLESASSRSSLGGPPLFRYLIGEGRKVALMMTIPAIVLAVGWLVLTLREGFNRQDRFIAGLALLGLDEVAFSRLASEHEYWSYPLVLFFAMAGGAGLAKMAAWLRARGPSRVVPVAGAAMALFLAQSALMLHRRLTTEGGYEFYFRLGTAVRETVRPDARVLLLTDDIPFYTPYYAPVFMQWYDAPRQELIMENWGPRQTGFSEDDLRSLLNRKPSAFDVAVTAEKDTVVPHVAFLRGLTDTQLEAFGVETHRTARREFLERRFGPPREHGGFLFWTIH